MYLFAVIYRHSENRRPDKRVYYNVFVPAFCDFFASFIMFVGLLWIPISIWQMIRSSIILFTGLIRQFWLKKPLKKSEWWALIVIFFSLLIVGSAYIFFSLLIINRSIFSDSGEKVESTVWQKILGMLLVFIAQGIQAFQTVVGML